MPDVDEPVDSRVGPGRAQRGSERQRVDDVAERAEADDQEGLSSGLASRPRLGHGACSRTASSRPRVE